MLATGRDVIMGRLGVGSLRRSPARSSSSSAAKSIERQNRSGRCRLPELTPASVRPRAFRSAVSTPQAMSPAMERRRPAKPLAGGHDGQRQVGALCVARHRAGHLTCSLMGSPSVDRLLRRGRTVRSTRSVDAPNATTLRGSPGPLLVREVLRALGASAGAGELTVLDDFLLARASNTTRNGTKVRPHSPPCLLTADPNVRSLAARMAL